jgi:hypothetical protein
MKTCTVNDNAQDDQSPKQDIYTRITTKICGWRSRRASPPAPRGKHCDRRRRAAARQLDRDRYRNPEIAEQRNRYAHDARDLAGRHGWCDGSVPRRFNRAAGGRHGHGPIGPPAPPWQAVFISLVVAAFLAAFLLALVRRLLA